MERKWRRAGLSDMVWENKERTLVVFGSMAAVLFLTGMPLIAAIAVAFMGFFLILGVRWTLSRRINVWVVCPCGKTFAAYNQEQVCPKCGGEIPPNIPEDNEE